MSANRVDQDNMLQRLVSLLNDARSELGGYPSAQELHVVLDEEPKSLLDQCLNLCAERGRQQQEPIRTLHHFACTGGSLISKCVAAMPNVQLLSEVDPLSTMLDEANPQFAPSDLTRLMRQSSRGFDAAVIADAFVAGLGTLKVDCDRRGLRLVLRDHAHGRYCLDEAPGQRPSVAQLAGRIGPLLSAVTVRHPLDSYLSLRRLDWAVFKPVTIDEYSRRYLAFLADHDGEYRMRYEDFVSAPAVEMRRLCDAFQLQFLDGFADLASAFRMTGDSGRSGEAIAPRARYPVDGRLAEEMAGAVHYHRLLELLGYDA